MNFRYIIIYTFLTIYCINAYEIKEIPRHAEISKIKEYKKFINLANRYSIENKAEKTLTAAKKAYSINKTKEALLIMARVYNYKKDYKNLLKTAEEILKLSPKNYLGHIYMANAYMKSDPKKAEQILSLLLKRFPKDKEIMKKLEKIRV